MHSHSHACNVRRWIDEVHEEENTCSNLFAQTQKASNDITREELESDDVSKTGQEAT